MAWESRSLASSWSPPATTPKGFETRPHSPSSVGSLHSPPAAVAPPAVTGSTVAAIERQTAPLHRHHRPHAAPPANPRLCRTPDRRGTEQARDYPLPQALHRPRDLHQPSPATSRGRNRRTCASSGGLTNIGASNAS